MVHNSFPGSFVWLFPRLFVRGNRLFTGPFVPWILILFPYYAGDILSSNLYQKLVLVVLHVCRSIWYKFFSGTSSLSEHLSPALEIHHWTGYWEFTEYLLKAYDTSESFKRKSHKKLSQENFSKLLVKVLQTPWHTCKLNNESCRLKVA